MTTLNDVAAAAFIAHQLGLCVVPPTEDGEKRPSGKWKRFQQRRPTDDEIHDWYDGGRHGIGLVTGRVSDGLEMFEFEGRAVAEGLPERFRELCDAAGLGPVLDRILKGYTHRSPKGGFNVLYRVPNPKGNTKLARRPATADELAANPDEKEKVLIETRGEGGYAVVPPSYGPVHPDGPYVMRAGGFETISTITDEERDELYRIAQMLDQMPVEDPPPTTAPTPLRGDGTRPGDAYNAHPDVQAHVRTLLEKHGWTHVFTAGGVDYMRRPGKTKGISATIGHADLSAGGLRVFTTSTQFDPRAYRPFTAYALLEHDGDYSAAAKALADQGYGDQTAASLTVMASPDRHAPTRPLAEPIDEVRQMITAARRYQDLPDPGHLLCAVAVAATRDLDEEPVWLLTVAPPSSGKTETTRMLDDVADARLDEVTAAGLLSWKAGRNPQPTGVLTRIAERAFVTFGDLSSLLATSDRGGRDQTFALLRRAYDGHVTRDLGNAPHALTWTGKLTIVGAVTGVIDSYSVHADALGPRWIYYRIPERDTEARRRAAAMSRRGGLEEARREVRQAATAAVESARRRIAHLQLDDAVAVALEDAALVTCWGRAAVPRHGYGRREIEGLPIVEEPPRLIRQLRALALGLTALGLDSRYIEAEVRRVALDSMPQARRQGLAALADGEPVSTAAAATTSRLDRAVARRQLEELEAIGVVRCQRQGREPDEDEPDRRRAEWSLAGSDGALVAKVFHAAEDDVAQRWYEMLVPTPPPPPSNPPSQGGCVWGYPRFGSPRNRHRDGRVGP